MENEKNVTPDPQPWTTPDPAATPAAPVASSETLVLNEGREGKPPRSPRAANTWQAPAVIGLFLVIATLAAIGGIALGSTSSDEVSTTASAPAVDACRTYDRQAGLLPTNDSPVVPCDEQHSAQTFSVTDVLPDPTSDGEWTERQITDAASTPCSRDGAAKALGLSDEQQQLETRLQIYFFVPTAEQAKDGARWVRCDLVLTDSGEPATVAGDFADLIKIDGAFAVCAELGGIRALGQAPALTRCTTNPALSAAVGVAKLGTDAEAVTPAGATQACRAVVTEVSTVPDPTFRATFASLEPGPDGQYYALCWIQADQWDVDRDAWPIETTQTPPADLRQV